MSAKKTIPNLVSIRCRRHKKRFNVPKEWAKNVCDWLCPACYEKLTAKEREPYKPVDKAEIRPAEKDGRVCLPSKSSWTKTSKAEKPRPKSASASKPKAETKPTPIKAKKSKATPRAKTNTCMQPEMDGSPFVDKTLSYLLPQYRIHCFCCNQDMPCHKSWFEQSKTLCPSCFSSLSEDERNNYEWHFQHESKISSVETPSPKEPISKVSSRKKDFDIPLKLPRYDSVAVERSLSTGSIEKMGTEALKSAVKKGHISAIRAKIELQRRKNKSYFDAMPETPGIKVRYF